MIKFTKHKEETMKIQVAIEGDVQEYALSFLHIWNNAREYDNVFLKVENNSSNIVTVHFRTKYLDSVREYLENFGHITNEEPVVSWFIDFETDMKGYDELYGSEDDYSDREFYIGDCI